MCRVPPARFKLSRRGLLLLGFFVAGLALRPQIVGIGPLAPEMQRDLGVSHALVGLLGTLPVLGMGVFASVPFYLARRRVSFRAMIAVFVAMVGLAGIARTAFPGIVGVLLLTLPIAVGMGVAGAALPGAVKEWFKERPGFVTALYSTGINVGAAVSALVAVPLAGVLGGWRGAMAVISAVSVLFAVWWLRLARRPRGSEAAPAPGPRVSPGPPAPVFATGRLAWSLALIFGLQGICYYGLTTWLAASYVERGHSAAAAGVLVAIFNFMCIPGSMVVPWIADRFRSRQPLMLVCGALYVVGIAGLLLGPGLGWLWAATCGVANGALFGLNMTLPLDASDEPSEVAGVIATMLGAGYVLAAASPVALGAVRDALGSFTDALWVLVATATAMSLAMLLLSKSPLGHRHGHPVISAEMREDG
jgi:CP family cyanate transporter-like MFS transporter